MTFLMQSMTHFLSMVALVLLTPDQSRKVGRNAKLMFNVGCHWKMDPPIPIQPTQPSSYTLTPPWLKLVGRTLKIKDDGILL